MQDDTSATIFGTDLSWDRYDELMLDYFVKRLRIRLTNPRFMSAEKFDGEIRLEVDLFRKKWFDYRFLHPVAATYLYAHHYERAYRNAFGRNIDRNAAEHIKVLKHEDLFQCKQEFITSIWRGRQIVDAIGAPYDFAIESGIRNTLRWWKQRHLPRPGQIFNDWVCETIVAEWEERKKAATPYSDHLEYRTQNYVGSRDQNDHHEHLLELADLRGNPEPLLSRFYENELLPIEKIEARFGAATAERILEAA